MMAKEVTSRLQKYSPSYFLKRMKTRKMSSMALYHAMAVKAVMARRMVVLWPW